MKTKTLRLVVLAFCATLLLALVACGGGGNVTVADLPTYPDAVRLQAGEDPIADTWANNMAQNAAMTSSLGVGGSIEQVAFRLPAGTTWDQLNGFLTTELDTAGWETGMGGPGGDIASQALASANAGNDMFQTAMWNKGDQILTVFRLTDPNNAEQPYLIVSLNTN
ncbi:MAG: hypothetical protein IPL28_04935 [Chloroflexi bacterium]|nr:hypothetical protein [Chloroflexota bacterium]